MRNITYCHVETNKKELSLEPTFVFSAIKLCVYNQL